MIRHAIAYARHGWPVFPLSRKTKGPLTRHGLKDASTDERQVRAWWERWPAANIGVRCDWFWVLDIDPRNGGREQLTELCAGQSAFPPTWQVITGSGGTHFYFKHDARFDSIPLGKWLDGIDVKGGGRGYVVAPPSIHPTTSKPYQWVVRPRDCQLAAAPDWLVRRIVQDKRPPPSPPPVDPSRYRGVDRYEQAARYARQFDPAIAGSGGHSKTFWVAQRLVRGFALSDDEAFALLSEWNQTCQPPWSERELRRKIAEARRVGSLAEGSLLR